MIRISLGVSLAGIVLLYFVSIWIGNVEMMEEGIYEEDGDVVVFGEVVDVHERNGNVFLTISRKVEENVSVVVFDEIDVDVGRYVRIDGRKQRYKGKDIVVGESVYIGALSSES